MVVHNIFLHHDEAKRFETQAAIHRKCLRLLRKRKES